MHVYATEEEISGSVLEEKNNSLKIWRNVCKQYTVLFTPERKTLQYV